MNKTMQHAIAAAFVATAVLQRQLKALGKGTTNGKVFQTAAAKCVAAAAAKQYKSPIVSYAGQRGVAFGIVTGSKEDGTPTYERTKACDATRKWFQRNIGQKKGKTRGKVTGVWAKIADDMSTLRSITNKLDTAVAKQLHKALGTLVKRFESEVDAK